MNIYNCKFQNITFIRKYNSKEERVILMFLNRKIYREDEFLSSLEVESLDTKGEDEGKEDGEGN